jgi:hypothetical protein
MYKNAQKDTEVTSSKRSLDIYKIKIFIHYKSLPQFYGELLYLW